MSAVASGEPDLALGQGQSDMNSAAPCPLAVPSQRGGGGVEVKAGGSKSANKKSTKTQLYSKKLSIYK